jgi:hypothetical protein
VCGSGKLAEPYFVVVVMFFSASLRVRGHIMIIRASRSLHQVTKKLSHRSLWAKETCSKVMQTKKKGPIFFAILYNFKSVPQIYKHQSGRYAADITNVGSRCG